MSILEELFKINCGAVYNVDVGIRTIKQEAKRSRKLTLNNVPLSLIEELLPFLENKDVSVALSEDCYWESIEDCIENISYYDANILASYGNQKINFGCIVLPNAIFDITWDKKEGIRDITKFGDNKCLKCDFRLNLCRYAEEDEHDIHIGKILNPDEGVNILMKDLKESMKVLIVYIPDFLVEQMIPLLDDKEVRILLPYNHQIHPKVRNMPFSRTARSWITPKMGIHEQRNAIVGGICFPHVHYGVIWNEDRILEIRTVEVNSCIRCIVEKHVLAWNTGKNLRA